VILGLPARTLSRESEKERGAAAGYRLPRDRFYSLVLNVTYSRRPERVPL